MHTVFLFKAWRCTINLVIKIDEAEIVHMEKLERISITLMNKASIPVITKNEATDFFCIPKENHEILSWLFNHTAIPTLVLAQNEGQLLQCLVLGGLEWSGTFLLNMKTIEPLHGLSSGANATECCIYYLQKKNKINHDY
jgi:hypothetical protein